MQKFYYDGDVDFLNDDIQPAIIENLIRLGITPIKMSPAQSSALDGAKRQDIIENDEWRSKVELGLQLTNAQICHATRISKYASQFLVSHDENDEVTYVLLERRIIEWMLGDVKLVLTDALSSVRKKKIYKKLSKRQKSDP